MAAFPTITTSGTFTNGDPWILIYDDTNSTISSTGDFSLTCDPIVSSIPWIPAKETKPPWPIKARTTLSPPLKTPGIRLAMRKDYQCRRT